MADYVWHAHEGEYPINDTNPILIQKDYVEPFPYSIYRIDETNNGYPHTYLQSYILQKDYVRPFPHSIWRIDENNGGYPYTYLMSFVPTIPPPDPPPPSPPPSPAPPPQYRPLKITIAALKNADAGNFYND